MTTFQIIALSSLDTLREDRFDEPKLRCPDALKAAQGLKSRGKEFRLYFEGDPTDEHKRALLELGGVE
jgi:hypothetical protein